MLIFLGGQMYIMLVLGEEEFKPSQDANWKMKVSPKVRFDW